MFGFDRLFTERQHSQIGCPSRPYSGQELTTDAFSKIAENTTIFSAFSTTSPDQRSRWRRSKHVESGNASVKRPREKLTSAVHRLLRGEREIPPDMEPAIDRIQAWIRHRTSDDVGGILEQSAGISGTLGTSFPDGNLSGCGRQGGSSDSVPDSGDFTSAFSEAGVQPRTIPRGVL
jgi:hypothetical protein